MSVVEEGQTSGWWDIVTGFTSWRLWAFFGLHDIRQRYRRSIIGPMWLVLGLGVTVLGIGLLYSEILKVSTGNYIPFIAISLLIWTFISTTITESTSIFPGNVNVLMSGRVPYTSFILRCIVRNLIVAGHCVIVVVVAFIYYKYPVGIAIVAVLPGLALLLANLYWIGLASSLLCARYRDMAQIVTYAVSIIFFLTPVIWQPAQVGPRSAFMVFNPFYHFVELIRGPIFENRVPWSSLVFSLCTLILGFALTFVGFIRFRRNVVYWI